MYILAPVPVDIITASQTGQFASVTALTQSGALLYSWIVAGSGQGGGGTGVSSAELAATGAKITALSGYTNAYIAATSGALDDKIIASGALLNSKINLVSGYGDSTFATLTNLALTGSNLAAAIATTNANLAQSGTNLYLLITNLSGAANSTYATFAQLTSTGTNLQSQISALANAGYITTGLADLRFVHLTGAETISGVKTFRAPLNVLTAAGDGLVVNINGISGSYAGNSGAGNEVDIVNGQLKIVPNVITLDWAARILSGEWKTNAVDTNAFTVVNFQRLSDVSGAIVSQISAAAAGVASLNGLSGVLSIVGTGGVTITANGQRIIVSGAASGAGGGGGITQGQLDSLSGYSDTNFLNKTTLTTQTVNPEVVFSDLVTNEGGTFLPNGARTFYRNIDGINTGELEITAPQLFYSNDDGSVFFSEGWDFVTNRIFNGFSSNGTAIDIRNLGLSGDWRLESTGDNQQTIINLQRLSGASGVLQSQLSSFATASNLGLTGSNLYILTTGLSGALQTKVNSLSGFTLGVSGALQNLISAGGTQVSITGSSTLSTANFTGIGGTQVYSVGGIVFISGFSGSSSAPSAAGTKTLGYFTPLDNNPPSSNYAIFDTRNSVSLLNFEAVVNTAAIFNGIIPEAAILTNGVKSMITWVAQGSITGAVTWGAKLMRMGDSNNIDTDNYGLAAETTTTTTGVLGDFNYTEITITGLNNIATGNAYRLNIYRNAAAGTDTMTGNAQYIISELRSAN